MPNLFRLFKPFKGEPLPEYPRIKMEDIPKASGLAWYGVNRVTELFGSRVYKAKFDPPASHFSTYLENGRHLNVGKFRQVQNVDLDLTERRRVDVIVYNMTDKQRREIIHTCWGDQSNLDKLLVMSDYAWADFLRFGVKWFKPTDKDFCSENHVENFAKHGVQTSFKEPYNSAPWDLVDFALMAGAKFYTLHVGRDFNQ